MNLMQQCKKMIDLGQNFDNSTVNFKLTSYTLPFTYNRGRQTTFFDFVFFLETIGRPKECIIVTRYILLPLTKVPK